MNHLPILAAIENPALILLFLILFFGLIAGITLVIRHFIPGLKDKGGKVNEEIAIQQELDRVLEPITDEATLKAIEESTKKKND